MKKTAKDTALSKRISELESAVNGIRSDLQAHAAAISQTDQFQRVMENKFQMVRTPVDDGTGRQVWLLLTPAEMKTLRRKSRERARALKAKHGA